MNCKPGDMALIVSSVTEENLGVFVDVIGLPDGEIQLAYELGHLWHCKARGTITYTTVHGERIVTREGPIPDNCLRPIRGMGTPKQSDVVTSATQQTVAA